MFFSLVSSTLWVFTTIYAIGYMQGDKDRVRFFGFFALCVSTTVGVAFAENLLTFFLFYETLTICTYPLVVHAETREALRAGRIYLTYTLIGGGFALIGAVMTLNAAGTLTLANPGILNMDSGIFTLAVIFLCLIIGFGVKAAIMPLHGWLPIAMVAPTPVSALLHAVAVVKVGAFGVTRVIYNVFGVELLRELGFATPLALLAGFTIVAASTLALTQDHLKRRLAYSTISQLSYIVLGAALLTPLAATAAVIHVANQAFAKITMFFVVGAITRTTGKKYVSELDGIGARMPWSMAGFTIAALSFVGVPLTAGFITKWYLALGALQADAWWYVLVLITSSLLNAGYWFPDPAPRLLPAGQGALAGARAGPPLRDREDAADPDRDLRGLRAAARRDRRGARDAVLGRPGGGGGLLRGAGGRAVSGRVRRRPGPCWWPCWWGADRRVAGSPCRSRASGPPSWAARPTDGAPPRCLRSPRRA
jgi:multicomponent Na+:H+ antiporter subunit D